jgi:hypothetical protein
MGIFDKVKGMLSKHDDKVDEGIDKAADVADDKLGDKVGSDKIDMAAEKAKDAVDKLEEG